MSKFLYFLAKTIGFFIYKIFFTIEVKGKENFPKNGPFIIASNHLSSLDPPIIGFVCPRKLYYFAKKSLFEIKVLSTIVKLLGAIPIERDVIRSVSLRKGLEVLKKGYGVVIFPEGTRSKDGKIKEGKPGIGFLAIKGKAPVIPVRLKGTNKALPLNSKFIRIAKIKVMVGKPIFFEKENYKEIGKIVMEKISQLK